MPTTETYKLFRRKNGNNDPYKMQVDSAIEDKNGVRIDTNYAGAIQITYTTSESDGTTYSIQLKTPSGANVGNAATFNIAVDSTIVSGYYDPAYEYDPTDHPGVLLPCLVLVLSTNDVIAIPVGNIVSGLASQTDVDNLELSIADLYSTGGTYAVGDLVMHNKRLYRCKSDIPTGEAWTAAHWDEANIDEELTALAQTLANTINNLQSLKNSVADEYSSSSTYAVGDLVMHNYRLYRCSTAITTAEAWNSAHWTAHTVDDEFTDIRTKANAFVQMIYNDLYPVGSIYSSTSQNSNTASDTNKQGCPLADVIVGSKWERIKGKFLYGAEDSGITIGSTGGAKTYTLLEDNLPAHTHSYSITTDSFTVEVGQQTFSGTTDSYSVSVGDQSFSGTTDSKSVEVGNQSLSASGSLQLYATYGGGTWTYASGGGVDLPSTDDERGTASISVSGSTGSKTVSVGGQSFSGTTGSKSVDIGEQDFSGTTDSTEIDVGGQTASGDTGSVGSGTAFSIMPPYLAIYIWKRTQ